MTFRRRVHAALYRFRYLLTALGLCFGGIGIFWPVEFISGDSGLAAQIFWAAFLGMLGRLVFGAYSWAFGDRRSMAEDGRIISDEEVEDDRQAFRVRVMQCVMDRRVRGYFNRKLVDPNAVIRQLADGAPFCQAKDDALYGELTTAREAYDHIVERNSDILASGTFNPRSVCGIICSGFLFVFTLLDFGQASMPSFGIAIAISIASGTSGWVFKTAKGKRRRSWRSVIATAIMLVSIGGMISPYFLINSHWTPHPLFAMWFLSAIVGYLLSNVATITQCVRLFSFVEAQIGNRIIQFEISDVRDRWADSCVESVIMPQMVLAINTLLGEDKDRLLVEQDSEGLRRLQDPSLTVSTSSEGRIASILAQIDGGSIAVAGPRGAGKSTILRKFSSPAEDSIDEVAEISVYLAAPAEYVPRDFLSELFQRLCEAYLKYAGYPLPESIYGEDFKKRWSGIAVRIFGITWLCLRALLILGIISWLILPEIKAGYRNLYPAASGDLWEFAKYAGRFFYREVYKVSDRWNIFRIVAGLILATFLPGPNSWKKYLGSRRESELARKAIDYLLRLQVDKTITWGASLAAPIIRGAGLTFNRGGSASYTPWTLPELVGHMRRFMEEVVSSFEGSTHVIVVGIDEIDRIGSVEQAEKFLGEVKAIFGVEKYFFLVSVAEDVGSIFAQRATAGRSILENAFDDVIVVDPLDFTETRELLLKRVPGFTDAFVYLVHALSGGLPRELIRVTRRLVDVNSELDDEINHPRLENLAFALVREQLVEAIRATRNQIWRLSLHSGWTEVFEELRLIDLSLREVSPFLISESYQILKRLDELSVPEPPASGSGAMALVDEHEDVAKRMLADFAAFSYFCRTVVDAFSSRVFDPLRIGENHTNSRVKLYRDLSAARVELSLSSGNSRKIIDGFRAALLQDN